MMRGDRKPAPLFSVHYIDAWADDSEGGWTWNQSFKLFEFRSNALDMKRAFTTRLRKFLRNGVPTVIGTVEYFNLGRGWYYVTDDWDIMELCRRRDGQPRYACIREDPR